MNYLAQTTTSGCTLNGKPIDCAVLAEKAKPFLGIGLAIFAVLAVIMIATFVLWVAMLIHAIKHNSKDRTLWIVALVAGFFMGFYPIISIVYFFAERKNAELADNQPQAQQTMSSEAPQKPEEPSQEK